MSNGIGSEIDHDLVTRAAGRCFLTSYAFKVVIDAAAGGKQAKDLMWEDVARVVADLAGENPTPTELLLARAAAADWLALMVRRNEYEKLLNKPNSGVSVALSEHHQRRIDRCHRRMLASVKMLALVRKLARPAASIQVVANVANVAQQQINGMPAAEGLSGRAPAAVEASWGSDSNGEKN